MIYWFLNINLNRCALCASSVHQLSRLSQRSLSVFVLAVSLSQSMRPSLHSVSPRTPVLRWLYPVCPCPPACSPPPFLERKSATVICIPGLWITLNLKGCNARYQRVIRALVSFMRWSHCKGAWSEQRVNSRPRR